MVPQISSLPAEAWPSPFDVAVLLAVALRPSSWLVMASPEIRSSPVPATMVSSPALAVAESPASASLVEVAVPPEPEEIGKWTMRERVWHYVVVWVAAQPYQKKKK